MNPSNFIKKSIRIKSNKKTFLALLFLLSFSCKKTKIDEPLLRISTQQISRCGTITMKPYLDSFVYPTFYITTFVHYAEGDQVVHIQGDVSGDHDSSWYFKRYDKDSSFCEQRP